MNNYLYCVYVHVKDIRFKIGCPLKSYCSQHMRMNNVIFWFRFDTSENNVFNFSMLIVNNIYKVVVVKK